MTIHSRLIISFILQLHIVSSSFAEEPPENVLAYAQLSAQHRRSELKLVRKVISDFQEMLKEDRKIKDVQERKKAIETRVDTIQRLETIAKSLENPLEPYYGIVDYKQLKIGDLCRLDWTFATVHQVVDQDNFIARFEWDEDDDVSRERIEHSILYWVVVPTETLSDETQLGYDTIFFPNIFLVTQNRTYSTPSGATNTILQLKPFFDIEPFSDLFTRKQETRIWKDASGKHETKAIYINFEHGKVHMFSPGGKPIEVKLSALCDVDQEYVRQMIKKEKEESLK